jgi:hypothetical protein
MDGGKQTASHRVARHLHGVILAQANVRYVSGQLSRLLF